MRTRVVFLSTSLAVVILFSGMIVASREAREGLFQALGNLAEVVHLVRSEYVDELNPQALQMSLDAGIVEPIDRWSAVLGIDDVAPFEELVQSPPPFGLLLTGRLSSAAARYVVPGSPAADAGLEPWEVIERVDGVNTRGRPLWQLRLELMARERAGTAVTLTVLDRQVEERREVELKATEWRPVPAESELRDVAVVLRVRGLPKGAADRIAPLVLPDQNLILDLRDLVWGLEEEAIAVADLFVAEGILGEWRGRRAGSRQFEASPSRACPELPTVLVGPETEGVGEILSAALQRIGATVVGGRTIGHAPHMQLVREGDLVLWIPVGLWLRPDGEPINGHGIDPGEVVEEGDESDAADPVLDRALELLRRRVEEVAA